MPVLLVLLSDTAERFEAWGVLAANDFLSELQRIVSVFDAAASQQIMLGTAITQVLQWLPGFHGREPLLAMAENDN